MGNLSFDFFILGLVNDILGLVTDILDLNLGLFGLLGTLGGT